MKIWVVYARGPLNTGVPEKSWCVTVGAINVHHAVLEAITRLNERDDLDEFESLSIDYRGVIANWPS